MATMRFRLSKLETNPVINRRCIRCGYGNMHIHGHKVRGINDYRIDEVNSVRLKCPKCGKTKTVNPEGLTLRKQRTDRVIGYGVMLHLLGLSYNQGVVSAMNAIGVPVSGAMVYYDFIEACEKAGAILKSSIGKTRVCVKKAGIDGTWQKLKGQEAMGLLMLTDLELDAVVEVEVLDEDNAKAVKDKLGEWIKKYGMEVIMTDEHKNYEFLDDYEVSEVKHYRCQAHFKKAKLKRIKELQSECADKGYKQLPCYLNELDPIIRQLNIEDKERIQNLYGGVLRYKRKGYPKRGHKTPTSYRIYRLITEVLDKFEDIAMQGITTNNACERQNGLLLKNRSKTMRGFEVPANVTKFTDFTRWVRQQEVADLAMVV